MKRMIYITGILLVFTMLSCDSEINEKPSNILENKLDSIVTTDSIFLQSSYFYKLKEYIKKNGRIENVDASSMADNPKYITYHILDHGRVSLTVDHSNRIYFTERIAIQNGFNDTRVRLSQQSIPIGNILLTEDQKVIIEKSMDSKPDLVYETYIQVVEICIKNR